MAILDEYFVKIGAQIDQSSLARATETLKSVQPAPEKTSFMDKLESFEGSELGSMMNSKLSEVGLTKGLSGSLTPLLKGQFLPLLDMVVTLNKAMLKKAGEMVEASQETASKVASGDTVFHDSNVRDTMTSYGVSWEQANSLMEVADAMGMSMEDLTMMTEAQGIAFENAYKSYLARMSNISDEMIEFNRLVEQNQLKTMNSELERNMIETERQIAATKELSALGETMSSITENWNDFMASEAMTTLYKFGVGVVEGIVKPIEWITGMFAKITGGDASKQDTSFSNTDNSNKTTNITINGVANDAIAKEVTKQFENTNRNNNSTLKGAYD